LRTGFSDGILGPKRDEVTGEWRKLHNEELHNLYSSPDIIRHIKLRRMGWEHGRGEESVLGLVGKPMGKRPIGRPRCRWDQNELRDSGWLGGGWSGFSWLRIGPVTDSCKYGEEPSGSGATELHYLNGS
jgi:hypothetical protein